MKLTNPIKAVFIVLFFPVGLLALPVQAHADWSGGAGMNPALAPNFVPNPGQPAHHEVHVNAAPRQHVQTPQRVQHQLPAQSQQRAQQSRPVVNHPQPVRPVQPVRHYQAPERHARVTPEYFRHDINYYGHIETPFPYADVQDVDNGFSVPDGYAVVMVNGETFYYNQGVFYQQVGDQLTAIPAVPGAVVENIPEDYQIVMADGVHYLFTGGVYYQRVDQGFQVVQPPTSDQE